MADLSTLSQQAPFAGAWATLQAQDVQNQQNQAETQRLQAIIQQLNQQTQQQSQMNPMLLDKLRLENQGLEADIPNKQAIARQNQTTAARSAATLDSDIAKDKASNQAKIVQDQLLAMQHGGEILKNAGIAASTAQGPGGGAISVTQYLKDNGIDESNSMYKYALANANNPKALVTLGDQMIQHSAAYRQAMDVENAKAEASKAVANINESGRIKATQMMVDAGRWSKGDSSSVDAQLAKSKNAAQSAEILENAYYVALNKNADANTLMQLRQRAAAARQRANEDAVTRGTANQTNKPDVNALTNGGIPVNPAPAARAPIAGVSPSDAAPAAANPIASGAQKLPPGITSVQSVRNLSPAYKNLSDDQIRQKIKAAYGVNLQ